MFQCAWMFIQFQESSVGNNTIVKYGLLVPGAYFDFLGLKHFKTGATWVVRSFVASGKSY